MYRLEFLQKMKSFPGILTINTLCSNLNIDTSPLKLKLNKNALLLPLIGLRSEEIGDPSTEYFKRNDESSIDKIKWH